jgi:hypothetical protein
MTMIRAEIQRYGQSILSCDKLLVFVCRHAPIRSQFDHIFAIAQRESWSLEFRPDGKVRFANIRSGKRTEAEVQTPDVVEVAEELTPSASARTLR